MARHTAPTTTTPAFARAGAVAAAPATSVTQAPQASPAAPVAVGGARGRPSS